MDLASTYVCLWTLLAFVLTWTVFYVNNRRKKVAKLADAETAVRRDGDADVIIVGAGVGGSALAYALAKDGRRVHVIERDMREPVRMMGEFMQPGGRLLLSKLGLQDCLEGIDEQLATGLAVYKDGQKALVSFPEDNEFPYEPTARTFYNGRFVQRLRQKSSSLPNVRLEEGTVKSLIEEKGVIKGVTYKNSAGEETTAFAPLTVVCDGCYSNLRRSVNDNNAEVLSYQVGYVSKNCQLEDPEKLKLIMSKPSFTMLYQISSTDVRCVMEIFPGNIPSISNGEMAAYLKDTMAPQPMSATVNTLGNAFSQVLIASTDEAKEAMRQGCFDYLSSGDFRTSGMMALLGGMNPRPLSLIFHLCGITISSIAQLLSPFPSPRGIWHSLRLFGLSMKMLIPHLKAEGVSQMLSPAYAAAYRKSYMAATAL
ncbi:Squalene epoxidase 6 [Hirschfeldia incana]|nr:Squalene epoxidase 6 [Hirschfeldia incana]